MVIFKEFDQIKLSTRVMTSKILYEHWSKKKPLAVTDQLVEVDLDSSSEQIMQHRCYYLLAALDEYYLLYKIGSSLLKLSDFLGFV